MNNLAEDLPSRRSARRRLALHERDGQAREDRSSAPTTLTRSASHEQPRQVLLHSAVYSPRPSRPPRCLAIRERIQPTAGIFYTRSQLGGSLLGQKKYSEAEPLFLRVTKA